MKITVVPSISHVRRACRDKSKVFRCRQGAVDMYSKPDLPNPDTPEQQTSRQAWSQGSAAWRSLTPEQKAHWNEYAAARGHLFPRRSAEPMTGYRVFQSAAGNRQILALPIPADAPQLPPPEDLEQVELLSSVEPDTLRLRICHRLAADTFRVVVSMSPATLRASRKADRRNGRHVRGWGQTSTAPLPASGGEVIFTGCRYTVQPGQRFGVWIRVVRESDGLSSPEIALDFIRPEPEEPTETSSSSVPPAAQDESFPVEGKAAFSRAPSPPTSILEQHRRPVRLRSRQKRPADLVPPGLPQVHGSFVPALRKLLPDFLKDLAEKFRHCLT